MGNNYVGQFLISHGGKIKCERKVEEATYFMNDSGDENSSSYCLLLTIKKMTTFHKSLEPPTSVYPSLKNKQINGIIVKNTFTISLSVGYLVKF